MDRRRRFGVPDEARRTPASDKTAAMELVVYDVVQVAGLLLILVAFVAALAGRTNQSSYANL